MKKIIFCFLFSAPFIAAAQTSDTSKVKVIDGSLQQQKADDISVESNDVIKVSTSLKKNGERGNETPAQNQSPVIQENNAGLVRPKND